jgi:hypothetical protein
MVFSPFFQSIYPHRKNYDLAWHISQYNCWRYSGGGRILLLDVSDSRRLLGCSSFLLKLRESWPSYLVSIHQILDWFRLPDLRLIRWIVLLTVDWYLFGQGHHCLTIECRTVLARLFWLMGPSILRYRCLLYFGCLLCHIRCFDWIDWGCPTFAISFLEFHGHHNRQRRHPNWPHYRP